MSIKAQATRGLKWQAIELIGRQLLSLMVFSTLSRLLAPADVGLFGLVGVYLTFVGTFVGQGIRTALIQRKDLQPEHIDSAFWFSLLIAAAICLGTIVLATPLSIMLGEPRLAPLLSWSSLGLVITAASTIHNTLFTRDMDFRLPALRMLLSNLIGGLIGISLAWGGFGVWALVGQQLGVATTSAIFLWSASSYRPSFRFSRSHYRELQGVSSSVFAVTLLWFLATRLDQIILNHYVGVQALGVYVIAAKLPELLKQVTHQPISQIAMPALSRLQSDQAGMRRAIYRGIELNATISFPLFIGLACVTTELLPLMFGKQWTEAPIACSLLALYTLVNVLQVFAHPALLAAGAGKQYVLLVLGQFIGMLAACLIGARYGLNYVALAQLINALVGIIPSQWMLHRWIGLDSIESGRRCAMPALAALGMAALVWGTSRLLPLDLPAALRLTCKISTGAIVYTGLLWLLKPELLRAILDLASSAISRTGAARSRAKPAT